MSKKRKLVIDADYIIFKLTESRMQRTGGFAPEEGEVQGKKYKESLKPYKEALKAMIKDIEDIVYTSFPGEIGKTMVVFSDPNTNFRYKLYKEYKSNREDGKSRSKMFYRLRKWAHKKYGYVKNLEADDVVAYYVRKGAVGASFDKDLLNGVPGTWLDVHYSRMSFKQTTEVEAHHFTLVQTLAGDPTDNIKGLPRVGHTTAIKLLEKFGWNWEGVVKAYKSKGMTEEDAILTRRLIGMDQWSPKKGLTLFKKDLSRV